MQQQTPVHWTTREDKIWGNLSTSKFFLQCNFIHPAEVISATVSIQLLMTAQRKMISPSSLIFIISNFFRTWNRTWDWIWNPHGPNFLMQQIANVRLFYVSSCIHRPFLFTAVHLKSMVNYLIVQQSLFKISGHKLMHFSCHQWSWFDLHPWKHWHYLCTSAWLESQWLSGNVMLMYETKKWGKGICHKQGSEEKSSPAFSSRYLYSFSRQYLFFNSEN